jgi:uncharacterized protein (TIGR02217 family)
MSFTIVPDTLPIFPEDLSYGFPGGGEYNTDAPIIESGEEQRNAYWKEPKYSWDVGYLIKTPAQLYRVARMHHACQGKAKPFRFKDHDDFKSNEDMEADVSFDDVSLGAAAVGQTQFQLIKIYTESPYQTTIRIYKPKGSTIRIGEDGVEVFSGWTVNEGTGIITRGTPCAGGEVITWGGEFYRKARFDKDKLDNTAVAFGVGSIQIPVMGLRGT